MCEFSIKRTESNVGGEKGGGVKLTGITCNLSNTKMKKKNLQFWFSVDFLKNTDYQFKKNFTQLPENFLRYCTILKLL